MFEFILVCVYMCSLFFVLGMIPVEWEKRPSLEALGFIPALKKKKRGNLFVIFKILSKINKPFCIGAMRARLVKDLAVAHVNITPEEFLLIKELLLSAVLVIMYPAVNADMMFFYFGTAIVVGYYGPEYWLRGKIKAVKAVIVKQLPDAIDLLGLCVNAGLDFMLSLKWVVDKSPKSVMIEELNTVLQEINVGKTRRDAIKDLASRYELPDLSTFARTLIQADKMGTSVTEALNILSEDMRIARYRRGEQMALKAPLKMLVPLLLFIFPVVGILVAGPIMLDFVENNPFKQMKTN
ncbi:MAG: type II secretion system F family protein [Candidatus Omnitrophica bacterium]|nr:type II secretion system F family protein [Candidatus Omnitrophota bacterium]